MNGKICLITGATAGIGKETAIGLAELGATVVIVGRNKTKTVVVAEEIRTKTKNINIHYLIGDLSSLTDVRSVAKQFKTKFQRLDVLINNAGGVFSERFLTTDGFVYTFALNHLAYFLLTNELLSLLSTSVPARIINVASEAHRVATIDWHDLQSEKKYSAIQAYSFTKLANIMFTYELDRRVNGSGISVYAVHPGVVSSNFGKSMGGVIGLFYTLGGPFMRTSKKGAETSIYLASSDNVVGMSGKYFKNMRPIQSTRISYDESAAKRLWDISEQFISNK